MKVIIACGGSGGHLFPGLAVAETLMNRGHRTTLLVSERTLDKTALAAVPAGANSSRPGVRSIAAVGWNGSSRLIPFCGRLAQAVMECARWYRDERPDVVLGMGGYTSAPAVLAARFLRPRQTATMIHESNAIPGRANRLAGRFVDHVAVGLADCGRWFRGKPVTVTGTPIRAALRRGARLGAARERLGLQPDRTTVLVMGGSQGAQAINESIACALPWLEGWSERLQFLHLSGAHDETFMGEAYGKNGFHASVRAFCHEMEWAYSAADVVISRAGAATLAEIAAYGLPAILIPYPHAAGNHQWHNARLFQQAGAARVIPQADLDGNTHAERGERLAGVLLGLVGDAAARPAMAAAARQLAHPDATDRIADLVEACGQRVARRRATDQGDGRQIAALPLPVRRRAELRDSVNESSPVIYP